MSKCDNCVNYQCVREENLTNDFCDLQIRDLAMVDILREDCEEYVCFV